MTSPAPTRPDPTSLRVPTPAGDLIVLTRGDVVIAAGFTPADALVDRLGLDLLPQPAPVGSPVMDAVTRWLAGDVDALDAVPVDQPGTVFQHRVWASLRAVPPGTTASYGDLALAVGRPAATRAVGSACGRNLLAPFVPCHRAVRSDGGLGGYAYGLEVKRWLLDHEAGHAA